MTENRIKSPYEEWAEFSLVEGRSLESIKEKVLQDGVESVCWSYLSEFADITNDNVEEFIALSTGLVGNVYKNRLDKCTMVDKLLLLESFNMTSYEDQVEYAKKMIKERKIRDRVDYTGLVYYHPNLDDRILEQYSEKPIDRRRGFSTDDKNDKYILDILRSRNT